MSLLPPTVFVVDDDPAIRDSLRLLLKSVHVEVESFPTVAEFLEAYQTERPGCVVADVRLPGASGLELVNWLRDRACPMPIIIMTAYADVTMAVRAMKAGVFDFLEKPCNNQVLLDRIQDAFAEDRHRRAQQAQKTRVAQRLLGLTPREREVLTFLVAGLGNKAIAAKLGISVKTVEATRSRLMEKMQADSLADLVRFFALCE